jgi:hypothetical protein
MSGYYQPATDPTTHGEFDDTTLREHNDLGWRLQHLPVPAVSLLLATAADENGDDGYTTNQNWLNLTQPPMTAAELVLSHGGHDFTSWNREIPYALSWISAHLPHAHTTLAPPPADATLTDPTPAHPADGENAGTPRPHTAGSRPLAVSDTRPATVTTIPLTRTTEASPDPPGHQPAADTT